MACAQSKNAIKNAYGIYEVHLPGNVAVDKNGHEIASRDTINFIYIETSSNEIKWDEAWKNNKAYSIIATLINSDSIDAGTTKETNKRIFLHAAKGNKIWQLRLIQSDKDSSPPVNISQDEILIRGSYNGKKIIQKVTKLTEVNSIPSV